MKKDFWQSEFWQDTGKPFCIWLGMVGGIAALVAGAYYLTMCL